MDFDVDLYKKYKVGEFETAPAINPLTFILSKAEIGERITNSEAEWLRKSKLFDTIKVIEQRQSYEIEIRNRLNNEIIKLKDQERKFHSIYNTPALDSENAFTLVKINARERLYQGELPYHLDTYNRFLKFIQLLKQLNMQEDDLPFYKTTESIVTKVSKQERLDIAEIDYLYANEYFSTINLLSYLLIPLFRKYKATCPKDNKASLYLLYILQKADDGNELTETEVDYTKKLNIVTISEVQQNSQFLRLKTKYKATASTDVSIKSNLYKVLKKIDKPVRLTDSDINFLTKRKLIDTLKFSFREDAKLLRVKINGSQKLTRHDVKWCEAYNYSEIIREHLLNKFNIPPKKDTKQLLQILKKLAFDEQLNGEDVIFLEGENLMKSRSKIFETHHKLQGLFYEEEFKRRKDHWCLVNASASYRKANLSEKALTTTSGVEYHKVKPDKLKAALLTTRGGACRDLAKLEESEKCALNAIKYYPKSHNPYTLMGALCYQTGRHSEGDAWFSKAEERGASTNSQYSEIKKILRKNRDQKLIDYLLRKDPIRFKWVKDMFSKKTNNNDQSKSTKNSQQNRS